MSIDIKRNNELLEKSIVNFCYKTQKVAETWEYASLNHFLADNLDIDDYKEFIRINSMPNLKGE